MPDLNFQINGVEASSHAASPQLAFKLEVSNAPAGERIHAGILQCQVRFEAVQRRYSAEEQEKLRDLFGAPEQWGRSLKDMPWTHVDVTLPSFTGRTAADLTVPCTYDLRVTSTKYLYALEEGEVPLLFLFSGTVFYKGPGGALQVQQVPRTTECSYQLPVQRWKELMAQHYPSTWLYLREDVFERLYAYKRRHGLPTWEQAVERLLPEEEPGEAREIETSRNGKSEEVAP